MHNLFCTRKVNGGKPHTINIVQVTVEQYETQRKEKIQPQGGNNIQNPTAD